MKKLIVYWCFAWVTILLDCSTLKKTSSNKTNGALKAGTQTQLQKIDLNTAARETNVLTYNPDGTIYQSANVKEQVDQATLERLAFKQKIAVETKQEEKVARPAWFWIVVIAGLLVVVLIFYLFRKI